MICQKVKNFNLGLLIKSKVPASSGLILIMSFAEEIGLAAELEKRLSHLKKRKRGYCVSEKILSFVEMLLPEQRPLFPTKVRSWCVTSASMQMLIGGKYGSQSKDGRGSCSSRNNTRESHAGAGG